MEGDAEAGGRTYGCVRASFPSDGAWGCDADLLPEPGATLPYGYRPSWPVGSSSMPHAPDRHLFLPRNGVLAALPPDDLARLRSKLKPVELEARQILHRAQVPIPAVYF